MSYKHGHVQLTSYNNKHYITYNLQVRAMNFIHVYSKNNELHEQLNNINIKREQSQKLVLKETNI